MPNNKETPQLIRVIVGTSEPSHDRTTFVAVAITNLVVVHELTRNKILNINNFSGCRNNWVIGRSL